MPQSSSSSSSKKITTLSYIWNAIFFFTITLSISLIFSLFQNEIRFFQDGSWENNDSIALNRGYLMAIVSTLLTVVTASYGLWRQFIPTRLLSMCDELSGSMVAVNGALSFSCFVLFFCNDVFVQDNLDNGVLSEFSFSLSALILSILYTLITIQTLGASSTGDSNDYRNQSLIE